MNSSKAPGGSSSVICSISAKRRRTDSSRCRRSSSLIRGSLPSGPKQDGGSGRTRGLPCAGFMAILPSFRRVGSLHPRACPAAPPADGAILLRSYHLPVLHGDAPVGGAGDVLAVRHDREGEPAAFAELAEEAED